jgi:beta-alanine degradation protein BauB
MAEPAHGTFDTADFAAELQGEQNSAVGTKLLLENDRVRIWEIRLEPGERAPFHWHTTPYFFVCVEAGRARTRFPNGFYVDDDNEVGETVFLDTDPAEPHVHDLENVGTTTLRFTTVELL